VITTTIVSVTPTDKMRVTHKYGTVAIGWDDLYLVFESPDHFRSFLRDVEGQLDVKEGKV